MFLKSCIVVAMDVLSLSREVLRFMIGLPHRFTRLLIPAAATLRPASFVFRLIRKPIIKANNTESLPGLLKGRSGTDTQSPYNVGI
jgi:hypothetical protein